MVATLGLVSAAAVAGLGWDRRGVNDLVDLGLGEPEPGAVVRPDQDGCISERWARHLGPLPAAFAQAAPTSYEARQLARLVVSGIHRTVLDHSNQMSKLVFGRAAAAADVDNYHTPVALGRAAMNIGDGGRVHRARLAGINSWEVELGAPPPRSDDPEQSSIHPIGHGLSYLATIRSHTDRHITQVITNLNEASRFVIDNTVDDLRLEFAARLIEHGRGEAAATQLDEVRAPSAAQ